MSIKRWVREAHRHGHDVRQKPTCTVRIIWLYQKDKLKYTKKTVGQDLKNYSRRTLTTIFCLFYLTAFISVLFCSTALRRWSTLLENAPIGLAATNNLTICPIEAAQWTVPTTCGRNPAFLG
jgi:hypothetical protein